jgi:hypothetical protein
MTNPFLGRAAAIVTSTTFSLIYVSLYQILIGGYVIYRYPYWQPHAAVAYVFGGIILQAWFVFRAWRVPSRERLVGQVAGGILYLAALALLPGSTYMS